MTYTKFDRDTDVSGLPFKVYKKVALTRAAKIDGPFEVKTSEGVMRCEDGFLAFDARGYPYPIATDEFSLIYEEYDAG